MRLGIIAPAIVAFLSPAFADDSPADCDGVYERLRLNAPGDASICEIERAEAAGAAISLSAR
jgi:hypothetical protein